MIEISKYASRLRKSREELTDLDAAASESSRPVELDQSRVGRLSRMDAMQAQAMSLEAKRRRGEQILKIDAALRRIESGDYGLCRGCDEPIEPGRLDYDPATPLCINCASRL